jgi:hypothetical protein
MNSLYLKLTTLAAAVAIAAGTASAQDVTLKASVPFSYTVQTGKVMPAGEYTLKHDVGTWRIQGDSAAVVPFAISKQSKTSDTPKLVFECRGHNCALRQIQVGRGEVGAYWPARKNKSDAAETARLVVVPLRAS